MDLYQYQQSKDEIHFALDELKACIGILIYIGVMKVNHTNNRNL